MSSYLCGEINWSNIEEVVDCDFQYINCFYNLAVSLEVCSKLNYSEANVLDGMHPLMLNSQICY